MPVTHVNRCGDTYYLHKGETKTGKPKYYFSKKAGDKLVDAIPQDYEIYENPNSQVYLRKIQPKIITDFEVAMVENGVRTKAQLSNYIVDVKDKRIIVYLPNMDTDAVSRLADAFGVSFGATLLDDLQTKSSYSPMMQFILADEAKRSYFVERWCFRGSIDDWYPLSGIGDLKTMVAKYAPHLGKESFFELF